MVKGEGSRRNGAWNFFKDQAQEYRGDYLVAQKSKDR
jgi:hypothetical protein